MHQLQESQGCSSQRLEKKLLGMSQEKTEKLTAESAEEAPAAQVAALCQLCLGQLSVPADPGGSVLPSVALQKVKAAGHLLKQNSRAC